MKNLFSRYTLKLHFFLSLLITALLSVIIFRGIGNNQFLFIHDEFLIFSRQEANSLLFLKSLNNLGISNVTTVLVTFYDQLYYLITYSLGLSLHSVQLILYIFKIFTLVFVPFVGFKRLSSLYLKENQNFVTLAISLWYTFNPFTLLNWNGGFSLTTFILYAFAPLCLFFYHKAIIRRSGLRYKLLAAIFLFLLSFLIYLFAVFIMAIAIYTVFHMFSKRNIKLIIKNVIQTGLLCLPLFSILIVLSLDFTRSSIVSPASLAGETAGNIAGGFFYPILLWFSWGIYTVWEPRNIQTFYEYFSSIPYIISVLTLYVLILRGIYRKKDFYSLVFFSIFLVFLFFVKGPQPPFGEIYNFFIKNVPLFILFRSPDNKFGFGIIFILALLLLQISTQYKEKLFVGLLLLIMLIQSFPLFTGVAVWGENTKQSWDRIITIPKQDEDLTSFINTHNVPFGYVMPLPASSYAQYWLGKNKLFIGQDLLPKLSNLPFIYLEKNGILPLSVYTSITRRLENNKNGQNITPIKYFLLRNDIRKTPPTNNMQKNIVSREALVFKTDSFELYKNDNAVPLLYADSGLAYEMVNPVRYNIHFANLKEPVNLYFNQNFDKDWKIFLAPIEENACKQAVYIAKFNVRECQSHFSRFFFQDVKYAFINSLFDSSHTLLNGYANVWKISPKVLLNSAASQNITINKDNSINFTLTIFYQPQSYFNLGIIATTITLSLYIFVILIPNKNEKRNSKNHQKLKHE